MSNTNASNPQPGSLIELGREAAELIAELRQLHAAGPVEQETLNRIYDRLIPIEKAIVAIPAKTMEEVRVKVHIAAWCFDGETINPLDEAETTDKQMAVSITLDLIDMLEEQPRHGEGGADAYPHP
jgi:hypothetical protein